MILHRNVVNVGYNVQAGCDSKHKLFVNNDTGRVNDTHALAEMALDAKALLEVEQMNTLTDKAYTTGVHIDTCTKNNIITYSSPKEHSSQKMVFMICKYLNTIKTMILTNALQEKP